MFMLHEFILFKLRSLKTCGSLSCCHAAKRRLPHITSLSLTAGDVVGSQLRAPSPTINRVAVKGKGSRAPFPVLSPPDERRSSLPSTARIEGAPSACAPSASTEGRLIASLVLDFALREHSEPTREPFPRAALCEHRSSSAATATPLYCVTTLLANPST